MRFQSGDVDHYKSHLSALTGGEFLISKLRSGPFAASVTASAIADVQMLDSSFCHGAIVRKSDAKSDLVIKIPTEGQTQFHMGKRVIDGNPTLGVIFDSKNCDRTVMQERSSHSIFAISMEFTRKSIEQMIERPVPARFELLGNFDPKSRFGTALSGILATLQGCCSTEASSVPLTHTARLLRDAAISTIVEGMPHSLSHWFEAIPVSPAPWQIRRAIEILHARVDGSMTVQDLASELGIGIRALQVGFRRHKQTTPLSFMKRAALESARRELQAGGVTIGDVARRWGFMNSGRFAAEYRAAFGEEPSRTKRET